MKPIHLAIPCALALALSSHAGDWRMALPGHEFSFPRDHYAHPEFKTEWWYMTGHLEEEDGNEHGFQITFFRQGIVPPHKLEGTGSRFLQPAFHFAHFALGDIADEEFRFAQKIRRGAFDEAGNGAPGDPRLAWIDDWELRLEGDGAFRFKAAVDGRALDLTLRSKKTPVLNGDAGLSQKAAGAGEATHYYALTRMAGSGTLTADGESSKIEAEAWLDREWGSNQLGPGQVGWDWFSIQLDDGRELMIYQLRKADGKASLFSSGTLTDKDGSATHLPAESFTLTPGRRWKSKATGGNYPISWNIEVPSQAIDLEIEAAFDRQELALRPVAYWEGAVEVTGSHRGRGFLEMTGYAAPLEALKR